LELRQDKEQELGIPQRLKLRRNYNDEFVVENLLLFETLSADEAL